MNFFINKKFNNYDKIKLNKLNNNVIAIGLATILLLSGCSNVKNKNSTAPVNLNTNKTETIRFDNGAEYKTATDIYPKIDIKIESQQYDNYINYINKINTNYKYSDLYEIDKALEKLNSTHPTQIVNHMYNLYNGSNVIDSNTLFDIVKNNNIKYIADNNSSLLKEIDSHEIKKICDVIAETINLEVEQNPNIDKYEVGCILGDLKMFATSTPNFAYINDDNCLVISPNMLKIFKIGNKDKDVFTPIIRHESIHLIQKSCLDKENDSIKQVGISTKFSDLKVNPLYFDWFYEASAEKLSTEYTKSDPLVYKYMIGYLESLNLSILLNDNFNIDSIERLNYTKDINNLFNLFNCKTLEEKKEIIKLFYSIEVIQNQPKEFLEHYNTVKGVKLSEDDIVRMKREIKPSICGTLTKYFYKSLASSIVKNKETMTLEDIFYLITLFENDINSHIEYENSDEKFEFNKTFMEQYIEIQDNLFKLISLKSNILHDSLIDSFNHYGMKLNSGGKVKYPNNELKWIALKRAEYLNLRQEKLKSFNKDNIKNVYSRIVSESAKIKR